MVWSRPSRVAEQSESQAIQSSAKRYMQIIWALTIIGVGLPAATIFFHKNNTMLMRTLSLMLSMAAPASALAIGKNRGVKELIEHAEKDHEHNKRQLASRFLVRKEMNDFYTGVNLREAQAGYIEQMPAYKQARLTHDYGLQGLVQPQGMPEMTNGTATMTVQPQLPVFDKKAADMVRTDWINHNFLFSQTTVFGGEGTGKSKFLALIAIKLLEIDPTIDLKIYTTHYDEDEGRLFPHMPIEVERSFIVTKHRDIYNDICSVYADFQQRVEDGKQFVGTPVIRIFDEVMGTKDLIEMDQSLGAEAWKQCIKMIQQVKIGARKYARKINGADTGMRFILGLHSLKKGETEIDSGILFDKTNVVVLGDSIDDPNTMLPSAFNKKQLQQAINSAVAQLTQVGLMFPDNPEKDKARPLILRAKGKPPEIVVLPKPDFSAIRFNVVANERANTSQGASGNVGYYESVNDSGSTTGNALDDLINQARRSRRLPTQMEVINFFRQSLGKDVPAEYAQQVIGFIDSVINGVEE